MADSGGDLGWENTVTNLGQGLAPTDPRPLPPPGPAQYGSPGQYGPPGQYGSPGQYGAAGGQQGPAGQPAAQQVTRSGPGVPATTVPGQGAPTAEQIWRDGAPAAPPGRDPALRALIGTLVSVALLIAAAVLIFLRLHHGAFGVTGVAITGQARQGCTVNVTGRIDTTGSAGTVSYEWVFQPQVSAPQQLEQTVSAGQSAVYVTAVVEGQGHGRLTQQATLKVLGPGAARETSARVTVSC